MQIINSLTTLAARTAALALVAIASLALFLPSGKAAIIISDDFSGAVDGANINGRVTPVGGATWTSFYNTSLTYNGGVTTDNSGGGGGYTYGIFTVPFSVGTYTSFEMTASVLPQGNNLNLAFTTGADALQINATTTIMAAINGGGGWAVFNGSTNLAGGGGLSVGAYHDAVLGYDVTTSTLTFSFNGAQLYSGVTNLSGGSGGLAGITSAGFSYNGITTNTTNPEFGSFSLAAVPEPSTFALAGLGGLALILRRRSRQRKLTA